MKSSLVYHHRLPLPLPLRLPLSLTVLTRLHLEQVLLLLESTEFPIQALR